MFLDVLLPLAPVLIPHILFKVGLLVRDSSLTVAFVQMLLKLFDLVDSVLDYGAVDSGAPGFYESLKLILFNLS
jgi:hypothetical protein